IIGAGVVGQATGRGLIKKGHDVILVDRKHEIVKSLKKCGFAAYLPDSVPENVDADVAMFCVSTPTKEDGQVDLSYIRNAIMNHSKWLKNKKNSHGHLLVIRSTVPPGTTRDILLPLIEFYSGMKVGGTLGLCMQPEF